MPRPPLKINWDKAIAYAEAQCSQAEIAAHLDVHPDTFADAIKRELKMSYQEFVDLHRNRGNASIRKKLITSALGTSRDAAQHLFYYDRKYLGGLPNDSNQPAVQVNVVQPTIDEKTTILLIKEAMGTGEKKSE